MEGTVENFFEYTLFVKSMKKYPERAAGIYPLMGLIGESIEAAEKVVGNQLDTIGKFGQADIPKLQRTADIFRQLIPLGKEMEQLKKSIRDKGLLDDKGGEGEMILNVFPTKVEKEEVKKELGDILWYITSLADDFGFGLHDIVEANVAKLTSRKERGVLHGEGDNR